MSENIGKNGFEQRDSEGNLMYHCLQMPNHSFPPKYIPSFNRDKIWFFEDNEMQPVSFEG